MTTEHNPDLSTLPKDGAEIEEIVLGLPADANQDAAIGLRYSIDASFWRHLQQLQRSLIEVDRVDALIGEAVAGLSRMLACDDVRLVLHDPVGEIARLLPDRLSLGHQLQLTPDSAVVTSLFREPARHEWLTGQQAEDLDVLPSAMARSVLAIPIMEDHIVVGAIVFGDPNAIAVQSADDLALLDDFGVFLPIVLRQVASTQVSAELMLVDPVTQVANRAGLEQALERELGRAQRNDQAVALVTIALEGLSGMGNLSQRHLQSKVLSDIAARVAGSLRASDTMARIGTFGFAVLMVDAPATVVPDVALRFETDLRGHTLDDGRGGLIEIDPAVAYLTLQPAEIDPRHMTATVQRAVATIATAAERHLRGSIDSESSHATANSE